MIQFDDGVTITHGKHVFKTGFQMWRYRVNTGYTGNTGRYGDILFGAGSTGVDFAAILQPISSSAIRKPEVSA